MEFVSRYVSHTPDSAGFVAYSEAEHHVWSLLYRRLKPLLPGRACESFIKGLSALGLSEDVIPQLPDVSKRLQDTTGWAVEAVPSLISARAFFTLLAAKKFPAATFIRVEEELDYVQEPDIFHELFGHCPMLTDKVYADFVHAYAVRVLSFPEADWPLLQRLFWFTVEFGLIKTQAGLRAFGGGILSSVGETVWCVESDVPLRVCFDPVSAFRMPYRIDEMQKVYFVIDDYEQLYRFVESDIAAYLARARALGEFPPFFPVTPENPNIHILAC
ncbi:phenylalanine-4-hydroxylase [Legionella geestiana]|uniref:Phenylalanine-4-hydroxylase n=1 Tax=Legionella geestiana TaxID=45065 RepID=A0A0W0TTF9_9GAMM|nr:phenylalanine 4-monooxygenase [Legionella geestiana]KTC98932.1 phenylalanine-4-hydroxylase [Legionella geestiana]QBS13023.1 phenylalanine 4-monooxygenase [Legionella geestiana]QDQ39300.1 phenylalanine 4-monooxygenase [Legionella geestiana]STX54467.1 phenylalanine-4-hydroxylase [Legionella geestiana]